MPDSNAFLKKILEKIARRYGRKGILSGTMKLGRDIGSENMTALFNFFGLDPLRTNAKEEVKLYFDKLVKNDTEEQWLEKIGQCLDYTLMPPNVADHGGAIETILSRLSLAFPDLAPVVSYLQEDCTTLERMLKKQTEEEVNALYFQVAGSVSFLLDNSEPITISELGARYFKDSKAIRQGELRSQVCRWLQLCSPYAQLLEDEADILAGHHVLNDRLTVNTVIYGPVIYEKNGKTFDWIFRLYQQGEAATISWSNIQNIDRIYWNNEKNTPPNLICCENEAPFSQLMREKRNQVLIFTSGFPNSATQKLYQLLAPQADANCHWGDSDPAGLRIAAIMHALHPLKLYRCDLPTLQKHCNHLISLSQKQSDSAMHILTSQPDFVFAQELLFTLENGWLEQESWHAPRLESALNGLYESLRRSSGLTTPE